jgi:WD40 repeat protein
MAWSPNGETIAYTENISDKVQTWNLAKGKHEYRLGSKYPKQLAWSPVKNWLAVAGFMELSVLNIDSEQELFHLKDDCHVESVAWSLDGKLIAYGDVLGKISIFDPAKNDVIQTIKIPEGYISEITWSPDGQFIAVYDSNSQYHSRESVQVYNAITGKFAFRFDGGRHLAWSPDGHWIATTTKKDNSIKLWNVDDLNSTHVLNGHQETIMDIKWSPDGTKLATFSTDGDLRIWGTQPK